MDYLEKTNPQLMNLRTAGISLALGLFTLTAQAQDTDAQGFVRDVQTQVGIKNVDLEAIVQNDTTKKFRVISDKDGFWYSFKIPLTNLHQQVEVHEINTFEGVWKNIENIPPQLLLFSDGAMAAKIAAWISPPGEPIRQKITINSFTGSEPNLQPSAKKRSKGTKRRNKLSS